MFISLQRVRSLYRNCAQANAPAASYWLRRVLCDGGRRDYRRIVREAEPATYYCL